MSIFNIPEKHILYSNKYVFGNGIPVALEDGGWMIVSGWENFLENGSFDDGVYWASFDINGQIIDPLFKTQVEAKWDNNISSVTAVDGGWLITWSQYTPAVDGRWILQQRLDKTGNRIGEATIVNSQTEGEFYAGGATDITAGGWIVQWRTWDSYDYLSHIQHFQLFDDDGGKLGEQQTVNSDLTPLFTSNNDGSFSAYYAEEAAQGTGAMLMMKAFDSNGQLVGTAHEIGQIEINNISGGQILKLQDGSWLVSVTTRSEFTDTVYQQRIGADGEIIGSVQDVGANIYAVRDYEIDTTLLNDGGWVTVWRQAPVGADQNRVLMRRYDAEGNAMTGPTRLSSNTRGGRYSPEVEALKDGGWIVKWNVSEAKVIPDGIYYQRYAQNGEPVENNNAPAGEDSQIDVGRGTAHIFNKSDFVYSDLERNDISAITVTGYSLSGLLTLKGDEVQVGDSIRATEFNQLEWRAKADELGHDVGRLEFQITDNGGATGSDRNMDPTPNTITFNLLPSKFGSGKADNLNGGTSNGFIFGLGGNDIIKGRGKGDHIFGGIGKDQIDGGGGNDVIDGGRGNDILAGGDGSDTFVFQKGSGHDEIRNFARGDIDVIDLTSFEDIADITQLRWHARNDFRSVIIKLNDHDEITIVGRNIEDLQKNHFVFYHEL